MAASRSATGTDVGAHDTATRDRSEGSQRPTETLNRTADTPNALGTGQAEQTAVSKRRRNHRGGKRKKGRRQSFAVTGEDRGDGNTAASNQGVREQSKSNAPMPPFYRLGQSGRNLSSTSLDSEALLDHRDHLPLRPRRESRLNPSTYGSRPGQANASRPSYSSRQVSKEGAHYRRRQTYHSDSSSGGESEADDILTDDRTPLLVSSNREGATSSHAPSYGKFAGQGRPSRHDSKIRGSSTATSTSSRRRHGAASRQTSSGRHQSYDVNNPPSVPGSPKLGPDMGYDDAIVTGSVPTRSPDHRRASVPVLNEQVINVDDNNRDGASLNSSPPSPRPDLTDHRRRTIALPAEEDVCFPIEGMSVIGEDEDSVRETGANESNGQRRRRHRQWPDLSILDEWSREEKEERSDGIRAKKISEPVLVGGRLRPQKHGWHRAEEDAPYRFTYFNEELPSTIHSLTISELLQPGQDFRELFIPDPPELSDSSSDDEENASHQENANERPGRQGLSPINQSRSGTRHSSVMGEMDSQSRDHSGGTTPQQASAIQPKAKTKKYGQRPTFWLDILSPTDTEMRVLSKTFGIHPLTAEDIMMQEAREKVELFRNYYFVNYRTFEQDVNSENYLEPVNMYIVVFREGVLSFHFSMTPHPANVRRRIRQLKDYLILSSDWISYAIIDDITDVFAPLIQSIEDEVDDIDEQILKLHSGDREEHEKGTHNSEKRSLSGEPTSSESGGDMLRRVGEGRKKVMGLYRLLGNKADVIKGFAKRCNEYWEVAPRSEIGLYLGDIQDHIMTMTSNLGHYETYASLSSARVKSGSVPADWILGYFQGPIPTTSRKSTFA